MYASCSRVSVSYPPILHAQAVLDAAMQHPPQVLVYRDGASLVQLYRA